MAATRTFTVDVDSILQSSGYIGSIPERLGPRLEYALLGMARGLLIGTFIEAMPYANSQGGFPAPFQAHVIECLKTVPIISTFTGATVMVEIDFDLLGTSDELSRAFHQGAKLEGGGRLWQQPYTGQALKQKNPYIRYRVWNAVFHGETTVKITRRRPIKLPEWASWEATMEARIDIWGDKAPEWLYIQYGQDVWAPKIPTGSVFEDFQFNLTQEANQMLAYVLAEEIATANAYAARGARVAPTRKGGLRLLEGYGGLSKSGKPILPGQFTYRIPQD